MSLQTGDARRAISVVIRTKDEADRLRLTLHGLIHQTQIPEVVVVNDGSSDHTAEVLDAAAGKLDLVVVHHDTPAGRSAASNIGADHASGEILVFLDGDTLPAPDFVERHLAVHLAESDVIARGETYHLRSTRFFADPEAGTPMPGLEDKVARMSDAERQRALVGRWDIENDFAAVAAKARPGIYPGAGPQLLYELEMNALIEDPACEVLWIAASGSNQSVPAKAFRDSGGFHALITINEHRELALRLCKRGLKMRPARGARSYHMTHRSGWRDPLVDASWERLFYDLHPCAEVALLSILWGSLGEPSPVPAAARLTTLRQLQSAALSLRDVSGLQTIRAAHLDRFAMGGARLGV